MASAGVEASSSLYARRAPRDTALMDISQWWPLVGQGTRAWLIAHNGERLTPPIVADILSATGDTTDPAWWDGDAPDGPQLTDRAVDWIEAAANDEEPRGDA